MGCVPSRYEREEIDRYEIFDERDRDDYDDCCGCGPSYGGKDYRNLRRRSLPGYGSPPGNYFGWGGYAGRGIYPGIAETDIFASQMAVLPSQVAVGPCQSQLAAVPMQSQIGTVPWQPQFPPPAGGIASSGRNGGHPYRRIGMW